VWSLPITRDMTYTFAQGMHNLIIEAFPMKDHMKTSIEKGHYDLIDASSNDIILPSVWHYFVEPGLQVNMRLWTIPGTPPPTIPQVLTSSGSDLPVERLGTTQESVVAMSSPLLHPVNTDKEVVGIEIVSARQVVSSSDADNLTTL
jgi:hypothetical protein